jgi:hypothetical protein
MVQPANASVRDGNDERTGAGTRSSAVDRFSKASVIVSYSDSNHQAAEDVKGKDTVDETLGGLGDIATGCLNLSSGRGDQLRGEDEGESRLDESSPEAQELSSVSGDEIRVEGTWILPVPETQTVMVRASTKEPNDSKYNQTDDGEDLQSCKPELGLSIE